MCSAGATEKNAAVAATLKQLRAFVRTDPARCAWQLCCPQERFASPEGQSVQVPHWGGHTANRVGQLLLHWGDLSGSAGRLGDKSWWQ